MLQEQRDDGILGHAADLRGDQARRGRAVGRQPLQAGEAGAGRGPLLRDCDVAAPRLSVEGNLAGERAPLFRGKRLHVDDFERHEKNVGEAEALRLVFRDEKQEPAVTSGTRSMPA